MKTGFRYVMYPAFPALALAAAFAYRRAPAVVIGACLGLACLTAALGWLTRQRTPGVRPIRRLVEVTLAGALWVVLLVVPVALHPGLRERAFVAAGLVDLAPKERAFEQRENVVWQGANSTVPFSPENALALTEDDWPCWRGPNRDGIAHPQSVATSWATDRNVLWQTEVGGLGHSSPIVVHDRLYLTVADVQTGTQGVLCIDAQTGKRLWSSKVHENGLVPIHQKNSHATATPASCGRRVYAAFLTQHEGRQGIWVTALDLNGNRLWQTMAGKFENIEGYGASLCLDGNKLFVGGDNLADGFLAALNTEDGSLAWRVPRPGTASYATPVVAVLAGRPQLLYHGCGELVSYDPQTGAEWWRYNKLPEYAANTPSFDDTQVFVSGGNVQRDVLAIRADGKGNVTQTHLVWRKRRDGAYVPSMLVSGEHLYVGSDSGFITCLATRNGQSLWRKRMEGNLSASPLKVGDIIFWPDEDGRVYAFRDAGTFTPIATNELNDGAILASMAVSRGRLFIRTEHRLWCIASP
jgi:outer membrane protein assembly factor BamB